MADSILVAEDEPASGEYLKLLLVELGFTVRLVTNGVEALLALETSSFDLVVTDLRMPSMDGFELLRHLSVSFTREIVPADFTWLMDDILRHVSIV